MRQTGNGLISFGIAIAAVCLFASTARAECENAGHEIFAPLIGEWEEYLVLGDAREHIGTLRTNYVSGNCGISQEFFSPDGSFSFSSLGYAGEDGVWVEIYVFSNGRVITYKWRSAGEELILDRVSTASEPERRLRIFLITSDSYHVSTEESDDGGDNWRLLDLVETVRKP